MKTHRLYSCLLLSLALGACAGNQAAQSTNTPMPPRKQITNPPNAQRLAPYSSAVRSGNLVFFSGVIGSRPNPQDTTTAAFEGEVQRALDALRNNLTSVGLEPADVVKCTVFMIDIAHYAAMNKVYGAFFGTESPPARSALAVRALPANARVEVECIAAAR